MFFRIFIFSLCLFSQHLKPSNCILYDQQNEQYKKLLKEIKIPYFNKQENLLKHVTSRLNLLETIYKNSKVDSIFAINIAPTIFFSISTFLQIFIKMKICKNKKNSIYPYLIYILPLLFYIKNTIPSMHKLLTFHKQFKDKIFLIEPNDYKKEHNSCYFHGTNMNNMVFLKALMHFFTLNLYCDCYEKAKTKLLYTYFWSGKLCAHSRKKEGEEFIDQQNQNYQYRFTGGHIVFSSHSYGFEVMMHALKQLEQEKNKILNNDLVFIIIAAPFTKESVKSFIEILYNIKNENKKNIKIILVHSPLDILTKIDISNKSRTGDELIYNNSDFYKIKDITSGLMCYKKNTADAFYTPANHSEINKLFCYSTEYTKYIINNFDLFKEKKITLLYNY